MDSAGLGGNLLYSVLLSRGSRESFCSVWGGSAHVEARVHLWKSVFYCEGPRNQAWLARHAGTLLFLLSHFAGLFLFVFVFCFCWWWLVDWFSETGFSPCNNPGCPGIHSVVQAGLKLRECLPLLPMLHFVLCF